MPLVVEDVVGSENVYYPTEQSLLLFHTVCSLAQQQFEYEHELANVHVEDIRETEELTHKLCHLLFRLLALADLLHFAKLLLADQTVHVLRVYLEAQEKSGVDLLVIELEEIKVFPHQHCVHCLLVSLNALQLLTNLTQELEHLSRLSLLVSMSAGPRV